jgi:FHA domain-containing protein
MQTITIALTTVVLLTSPADTRSSEVGLPEATVAWQAGDGADAALPAPIDSTRITSSQAALPPVSLGPQPLPAKEFLGGSPLISKLLFFTLAALGVFATWEIVTRWHRRSKDDPLPLVLVRPYRNRSGREAVPQPAMFGSSAPITPAWPGSAGSSAPRPPDAPSAQELVSSSAPRDGTMLLLPGRLEIVSGNDRMKEVRFVNVPGTDVVTFGRHEGETYTHVRVDSPTVSRMHATMRYSDRRWLIRNLSATNPVVLNGEPLPDVGNEQELHDGDRVEMGEVIFRFRAN